MVKVNKEAYIPLLTYDLGYEETVLQLIKSLDCLDKVVDCVYEHVRSNIRSQTSEIVKLNDKLNNVTNKVHRLSNIKKSIQVFSSSKYPAAHCQKDYEYSYDFDITSNIIENIQVTHQICVIKDRNNKTKFYSVNDRKLTKNKDIIQMKGLGKLPDNIKYINSLLLFNSNENVYHNYVLSNPYKINKKSTNIQVDNIEHINKPIFTLPLNDIEKQFNYSYTPVCEEVPSIDVPADLPDLPGIAEDTQCFKENNVNMPTVCKLTRVVDLPSFDELDDIQSGEIIADDPITIEQEIGKSTDEQSSINKQNIIIHNITDHIENNNFTENDQETSKIFNDNVNSHSILMDEIRNAGGLKKAKLRSVNDRLMNKKTLSTGEGLMADLHKKLAMRRQGISGNNQQNDSSMGGLIYRMASTMLPPNLESESEADGDEDTEGDWDD